MNYHDTEWGRPVVDDLQLFEKVCLEGFQSGLSWITILRKREKFRELFCHFNPDEVAENMKKYGGFVPGIRAGRPTSEYLQYVLSRITAPGSLYLAFVAVIPIIALVLFGASQNFPFGGTAILIVVGVGLDTAKQIESQLQQRSYEGFLL